MPENILVTPLNRHPPPPSPRHNKCTFPKRHRIDTYILDLCIYSVSLNYITWKADSSSKSEAKHGGNWRHSSEKHNPRVADPSLPAGKYKKCLAARVRRLRLLGRWAIYQTWYQTEAIENCCSVWKFQGDFSEKKNILKIQKQLQFGQKIANYWQLFL
jgi:hypothetical protein